MNLPISILTIQIQKKKNPYTCLKDYFEGDDDLVKATLIGFRGLLQDRDDLPDLADIAQLHQEGRRSLIALPCLAAMVETYKAGHNLRQVSESGILRALGFYLVTETPRMKSTFILHNDHHYEVPDWYKQILMSNPDAIAEAMVLVHNANVRSNRPPHSHMYDMAFDSAYAQVAQSAVSRMFTVFPSRCNSKKLESLHVVVWGAILNHGMTKQALEDLITRRLKRKGMDIGQQVLWLAAGLSVMGETYLERVIRFLSTGQEIRMKYIIDLLVPSATGPVDFHNIEQWSSKEICRLVQILGSRIDPPLFDDYGIIGDEHGINSKLWKLFKCWLGELKKRTCEDARKNLDSLGSDEHLLEWKKEIAMAQKEQSKHRRMEKYSDLRLDQIQEALRNGVPANAADLVGLTLILLKILLIIYVMIQLIHGMITGNGIRISKFHQNQNQNR